MVRQGQRKNKAKEAKEQAEKIEREGEPVNEDIEMNAEEETAKRDHIENKLKMERSVKPPEHKKQIDKDEAAVKIQSVYRGKDTK